MGQSAARQIRFADNLAGIVDPDGECVDSTKSTQVGQNPVLPDKWMGGLIACEIRCADDLPPAVDFYAALCSWPAGSAPECAEGNHSAVLPKEWFLGSHAGSVI